jgi:hypothetical protein
MYQSFIISLAGESLSLPIFVILTKYFPSQIAQEYDTNELSKMMNYSLGIKLMEDI